MSEVADRYARAFFGLTADADARLSACAGVLDSSPPLCDALAAPQFSPAEKRRVIDRVFADESAVLRHFLMLLCDKGRIGALGEIAETHHALTLTVENAAALTVTSARALPADELGKLTQKICATRGLSRVETRVCIDEELLGGFLLETQGTVWDFSARGSLTQLRRELQE